MPSAPTQHIRPPRLGIEKKGVAGGRWRQAGLQDGVAKLLGISPEAAVLAAPRVADLDIPTDNQRIGRRVVDLKPNAPQVLTAQPGFDGSVVRFPVSNESSRIKAAQPDDVFQASQYVVVMTQ